eukprot:1606098-Pleurochrysis_carterae.AAC.1
MAECDPTTVLAFHHPGLVAQAAAAAKAVEADAEEGEWVSRPMPHLLFVPWCLRPRDVIMQRVHVRADGSYEVDYDKPRVTTNSSYGGTGDGVNASGPRRSGRRRCR